MNQAWTAQQIDELIANVRSDMDAFASGGNTLDRENILDLISALDALRAEIDQLRDTLQRMNDAYTMQHDRHLAENERLTRTNNQAIERMRIAEFREEEEIKRREVAEAYAERLRAALTDLVDNTRPESRMSDLRSARLNALAALGRDDQTRS